MTRNEGSQFYVKVLKSTISAVEVEMSHADSLGEIVVTLCFVILKRKQVRRDSCYYLY